jgi:competence protein ComEC
VRRDRAADPDPDGVALAAATATGVLLGAQLAPKPPWVPAATCLTALCLAATCLATAHSPRPDQAPPTQPRRRERVWLLPLGRQAGVAAGVGRRARPGGAAGMLVLLTLLASGAAVAGVRAAALRGGVLAALAGRPGMVEVAATVAEEPHPLAWGGRWVVLSVRRVTAGGRAWRTRERAGSTLPASAGRLGVGDRLWLRAGVGRARLADRLGHRPAVVLTHPLVQARAPPTSRVLRASEAVREAARGRALASLPPDRAGLLVGMALGDTSLLPSDLEQAFRAAGLTHLMAVSGQDDGQ